MIKQIQKSFEILGYSAKSSDDAIRDAIGKSPLRFALGDFELIALRGNIQQGDVTLWHAIIRVSVTSGI